MSYLDAVIDKGSGWSRAFSRIMAINRSNEAVEILPLSIMRKTLALSCDLAFRAAAPMLIANTVRNSIFAIANGLGESPLTLEVVALFDQRAGVSEQLAMHRQPVQ